jgi:uncharacterized phage-associated protein
MKHLYIDAGENMSTKSLCAAQYILNVYNRKHLLMPINGMKLIKLLYLAHGWSLGFGTCWLLDDEDILCGKNGPLIDSVYQTVKRHKQNAIEKITDISYLFSKEERDVMNQVVNIYGSWDVHQLYHYCSQKESPWAITIELSKEMNEDFKTISNDLIMDWFRNVYHNQQKRR